MVAKRWIAVILALGCAFLPTLPSFADDEVSSETLSDISQNCSSIKLQLDRVQKEDSRLRMHLGIQYETISTNFMQNLNLRLVRNNLANADLSIQQTSFFSERERFKTDFVDYSQAMDELVKIDCRAKPDKFYMQLKTVRAKRAEVYSDTERIRELVKKHYNTVNSYKDQLYNKPTPTPEPESKEEQ